MSCATDRCERLEALLDGALSVAATHELKEHLGCCSACRVELQWLSAERVLLAQRARRDEAPAEVWSAVDGRLTARPLASPAPRPLPVEGRGWRRVALALAASVLVVTVGQVSTSAEAPPAMSSAALGGASAPLGAAGEELGFSVDLASEVEQQYAACLLATPRTPLRCRPLATVPASFP